MQVKRQISKRIRRTAPGINLVAAVDADVSVNVRQEASARADRPPARNAGRRPDERGKEQR